MKLLVSWLLCGRNTDFWHENSSSIKSCSRRFHCQYGAHGSSELIVLSFVRFSIAVSAASCCGGFISNDDRKSSPLCC